MIITVTEEELVMLLEWMGDFWAGEDFASPFTWGLGLDDHPLCDGREPKNLTSGKVA